MAAITHDIAMKTARKRSPEVEKAMLKWIFAVIGEPVPENGVYEEVLQDGVVLCKLMNKIAPGSVSKVNTGSEKFKLMENVNKFIAEAEKYGVKKDKLFRTIDLFEKKNIPEVTGGLIALARAVNNRPDWKGAQLEKWVFAEQNPIDQGQAI